MNPAFNMFNNNMMGGMPAQPNGMGQQPMNNDPQVFKMNPETMVKNFLQSGQMSQQQFNECMRDAQQIMQMIGR